MDGWAPLHPDEPVVHVSWFEADALARSLGARLPTEPEWEKAAAWDQERGISLPYPWGEQPAVPGDGRANLDQTGLGPQPAGSLPAGAAPSGALGMLGDTWEWTSTTFHGYPGFTPHPYPEYSEVFFGDDYRVLRGGSWATRSNVATTTFRNWDLPQRRQIFSGVRLAWDVVSAVVDSHLDTDAPRTLAEDVLDGLTRPAKELRAQVLLRRARLGAVRPHHRAPGVLPDARRAGDPRGSGRRDRGGDPSAGELVELGAGTATKTRVLLDAMARAGTLRRYVPFDVDEQLVRDVADALAADYPGLEVHGVAGDFERHLDEIPPAQPGCPRIVAFLGGTIGNFPPGSRRRFLRSLAERLDDDGFLLLGTDLVKDPRVLEAAYDDSAGVTAEFNRNVLRVLNRELGADFDPELFDHVAFFDPAHEWIEMRLRARRAHTVHIPAIDLDVAFARGEELRTEISAKFTPERVAADLAAAGLELSEWLTDAQERFALSLARRRR